MGVWLWSTLREQHRWWWKSWWNQHVNRGGLLGDYVTDKADATEAQRAAGWDYFFLFIFCWTLTWSPWLPGGLQKFRSGCTCGHEAARWSNPLITLVKKGNERKEKRLLILLFWLLDWNSGVSMFIMGHASVEVCGNWPPWPCQPKCVLISWSCVKLRKGTGSRGVRGEVGSMSLDFWPHKIKRYPHIVNQWQSMLFVTAYDGWRRRLDDARAG